jgi:predicted RNA binding protein YcfA (HicA-like mRNA interferase family)
MRIRDVVTLLEEDGWVAVRSEDTLRQLKRKGVRGRVTLAGKADEELPEALVRPIAVLARLEDRLL